MRAFPLVLPAAPDADVGATRLDITAPEGMYIPRVLERDGLAKYEPGTLASFLALIERHPGPVFDVGANIGVFSLVAAAVLDADVTAFEPTPPLADVARKIAGDNGLVFPVEPVALGDKETVATFYLSDLTDSSNSLAEGFRPSHESLRVEVERLDHYVERTGVVPRVLKVDTETTEPDVLEGARETLREHRPWIVCEVLARKTEADLERIFGEFDYHWYQITEEERFVERREIFGDRAFRFLNWLFTPEPLDDDFWAAKNRWRHALRACTPVGRG